MNNRSSSRNRAPYARGTLLRLAVCLGVMATASVYGQLTWGTGGAGGTGTWDQTTTNWWDGTTNVAWSSGGNAVFAGTAGTVSLSLGSNVTAAGLTFNTAGYTLQGSFLNGSVGDFTVTTNADATLSAASIFGKAGTSFVKDGAGTLTINGSSSVVFSSVSILAGEMRFTGGASVNGLQNFALANAPGVILSISLQGETLTSLSGGGTAGGIVRPINTSGSSNTLVIYDGKGSNFGGSIQDNGAVTMGLEKDAAGTQYLSGANTYSGATTIYGGTLAFTGNGSAVNSTVTINSGAQLLLDNSGGVNANRISDTALLTISGGTLGFIGNATSPVSETVGALKFSAVTNVSVSAIGATSAELVFASLQRSSLGVIAFSGSGTTTVSFGSNTNGIIGGYATVGNDWASFDANHHVVAFSSYVGDLNTAQNTDNVRLTMAGTASLNGTATRSSLNLANNSGAPAVLDLGAANKLTLSSGGLLASGSSPTSIQNGSLTSSLSDNDLIITNNAPLTISSTIVNTSTGMSLSKTGSGTLTLTGANTYSGTTIIDQGVVAVSSDANLGTGTSVSLRGGTLRALAAFTSTKALGGSNGGAIDTNGFDVTFGAAGAFTKTGDGKLTLSSPNQSVGANVQQGTLVLNSSFSNVSLGVARLEGSGTYSAIYSTGGTIAPGGSSAVTLSINTLQINSQTVFDFALGSGPSDLINVTFDMRAFGGAQSMLFHFTPSGVLATGTDYTIMNTPSISVVPLTAAYFGLSSDLIAAGWNATFAVSSGKVTVNFSSVPEPHTALLGAVGFFGLLARRYRRRKVTADGR